MIKTVLLSFCFVCLTQLGYGQVNLTGNGSTIEAAGEMTSKIISFRGEEVSISICDDNDAREKLSYSTKKDYYGREISQDFIRFPRDSAVRVYQAGSDNGETISITTEKCEYLLTIGDDDKTTFSFPCGTQITFDASQTGTGGLMSIDDLAIHNNFVECGPFCFSEEGELYHINTSNGGAEFISIECYSELRINVESNKVTITPVSEGEELSDKKITITKSLLGLVGLGGYEITLIDKSRKKSTDLDTVSAIRFLSNGYISIN